MKIRSAVPEIAENGCLVFLTVGKKQKKTEKNRKKHL